MTALRRLDWGVSFWRFVLLYFLLPWVAFGACLRMRRDGSPWPLVLRLSHFAVNYIFLALQVVMIWLWIRLLVETDWVGVAILPFAALSNLLVLVIRLRTVYKFSRGTAAAAR